MSGRGYLAGNGPGKQMVAGIKIILNSSAVEQSAVNRWVVGSNPTWGVNPETGRGLWPDGQAVKTRPFHGCNPGSIPGRVINIWRRSQVVRQRSATPLCIGSNPIDASLKQSILWAVFCVRMKNISGIVCFFD